MSTENSPKNSIEENRFKLVVEAAPNAMVMIDKSRKLVMVNKQAEVLFGYSRSELLGKQLEMLIPERFRNKHPEHVAGFFEAPVTRAMGVGRDLFGLHKDGTEVPIEIGLNPIQTESDFFILASIIDITERKKIEQMKNEFVSTVSHELRTPLTSIRGSLGLILGGATGEIPPKAKQLIQIALNNCERLVRLINDILDIEKIEAGNIDFEIKEANLMEVIRYCISINEAYAQQYGVKIELVETDEMLTTSIDVDRITQVITNLISNAVKFSDKGKKVKVTTQKMDHFVHVSVIDEGKGIPDHFKSKIFGKFAQADASNTRQKGGTGLGLNICKAIIEKHGGKIGFQSVLNQGSTFFFELPLVGESPNIVLSKSDALLPRFLVCEPNSDISTILRMHLEHCGFKIDIAKDARSAKKLLFERNYMAMSLDLMLPDQNGLTLLQEIRKDPLSEKLPVIIISAKQYNDEIKKEIIQDLRITDWLLKPISYDYLKQVVHTIKCPIEKHQQKILYVEDDEDIAIIVDHLLRDIATVEVSSSCLEARHKISEYGYLYKLIILDLGLKDGSGLSLLPLISKYCPKAKVVIFSALNIPENKSDEKIDAVLLKTETSNEELLQTVDNLLNQ